MLRQASTADLRTGVVTRKVGHVAVTMRTYPRQIKKTERDEYLVDLSPDPRLFRDFKDAERRLGDHERAFAEVDYESRFALSRSAMRELERLAKLSAERDVFLICQCPRGERCHREMLLLIARHRFDAETEAPVNAYPRFEERLRSGDI